MNLIDVTRAFTTDDECLEYLEQQRWPEGVRCPTCGDKRVSKVIRKKASKNKRTRIYQCNEKTCKQQFSATNGTMFHDTHLPLPLWFAAIAILLHAKKSVSAMQLQRHLGIKSYKTAWYLAHRIRRSMSTPVPPKMTGTVEMDEMYIGGKSRANDKRISGPVGKEPVVGFKQRQGTLRLVHLPDHEAATLGAVVANTVSPDVEAVMTDEASRYPRAFMQAGIHGRKHHRVYHSKKRYVDGMVTTNGIESIFALFKRAIIGSWHRISPKHLHRYLSECEYRFNERDKVYSFQRTVLRLADAKPMPYRALVA